MPIRVDAPIATTYKQTDAQIWAKVSSSLMNIGVPVTPIMIRRARGTILYVSPTAPSASPEN